ncbi:MAG: cytochrome c, partial [Actinomycetia bacterium]|nr:cytochrome c [Actinomycetes bacterium]
AIVAIAVVVLGLSAPAAMAEAPLGVEHEDVATAEDSDTTEEESETVPGVSDDTLRQGATVYGTSCSSCHQAGGAGIEGTFPPLVDNPNVTDADYVRQVIVDGKQGAIEVNGVSYDGIMPPFATMASEDVDALVVYITNGFATPAVEVVETVADDDSGSQSGWIFWVVVLVVLVVGSYVFRSRILGRVDRLEMPWFDAWLKAAVIVIGFIVLTVYIPDLALKTDFVADLNDFGQNVIGVGLWTGGLLVGLGALWYAYRDRRI